MSDTKKTAARWAATAKRRWAAILTWHAGPWPCKPWPDLDDRCNGVLLMHRQDAWARWAGARGWGCFEAKDRNYV